MENVSPDKAALKRSRVTALVFAALTILSLLLLVYAFIQKAESERLMVEVTECKKNYEEVVSQLEQEKVRAEEDFRRAERLYQEAKALEEQARQNTK
jgi:ABC-type bacteriocin/lantibiotic exporter with double-glycine peptidase domain